MNRSASKWIRIAVTGILFLLLLTGCAGAAGKTLTASCPSVCGEKVVAREGKAGLVLSLPGFWDLSRISLEMDGVKTLIIGPDKKEIVSGEETDLTGMTGWRIVLRNEKRYELGYLTILQGSQIPALFLEVDGEELKKVNRSKDNQITEGRAACYDKDGSAVYDGSLIQLKGRGNNTFRYSKKPYQLKLAEKAPLCGMGRGKTWILLANWTDVSLLRNQIVLDMSREIGLRNAVNCSQADVWINGAYNGLYLLAEKVQVGKERIGITNLEKATEAVNGGSITQGRMGTEKSAAYPLLRSYPDIEDPEDITGGYIMTIEKKARLRDNKLAGFRTKNDLSIRIKEPTYPSRKQAEYLFERITQMQNALKAKDGIEPETGKPFEEYLDVDSFARKFLIEEWCKNYDFIGGSQFLYKDSDLVDPLIYAGPSWDYDLSFGNMADRGFSSTGKYVTAYRKSSNLYWLLYEQETFRKAVGKVWQDVFRPAAAVLLGEKEPNGVLRSLKEYREQIADSAAMNYKRWTVSRDASGPNSGENFDHAVKYLEKWITERTAWMDGEYMPKGGE